MTTLVIGSGLIGTQVARLLAEEGERPVVMEVAPQPAAIGQLVDLAKIRLIQGDVLDPDSLAVIIKEHAISRIIHTAANATLTAGAQLNPLPAIQLNIMGTANVLEAGRIFNLERVVFSSSSVLYNNMEPALDQDSPTSAEANTEEMFPRPSTFYATTKQAGENLGLNYHHWFGLDFVAVRYAAAFGPWGGSGGGGEPTQMMRSLVESALKGEEAVYRSRPMEYVYSKDAALGTVRACRATGLKNRVFNINSGGLVQPVEVVQELQRLVPGARVKLEGPPSYLTNAAERFRHADLSRSREQLGYEPQYPFPKALADYVAWTAEVLR